MPGDIDINVVGGGGDTGRQGRPEAPRDVAIPLASIAESIRGLSRIEAAAPRGGLGVGAARAGIPEKREPRSMSSGHVRSPGLPGGRKVVRSYPQGDGHHRNNSTMLPFFGCGRLAFGVRTQEQSCAVFHKSPLPAGAGSWLRSLPVFLT